MSTKNIDSNQPMICDRCGRSFKTKVSLINHMSLHTAQENVPRTEGLTCFKCNIVFKNRGLLMCHNVKVHEKRDKKHKKSTTNSQQLKVAIAAPSKEIQSGKYRHVCQACQINFFHPRDLQYHIREFHFNLISQVPYCDFKKVNQIWFEKVLNSKNIVEIKKAAQNILLMRKLDDNTSIKVGDNSTEIIDLRDMYPSVHIKNVKCQYCFKVYDRNYIKKHVNDTHIKYDDKLPVQT